MKINNKDCKIVQDLMPSYIENLLSKESKEFVDEHISTCNNCKNFLATMNTNISGNSNNDNANLDVDYLKKYRKKLSKFKIILYIILGILVCLFIIAVTRFTYNNYVINKVNNKRNELMQSNNFCIYKKQISVEYKSNLTYQTENKLYYKDGKYKMDDAIDNEDNITIYGQIDSPTYIGISNRFKLIQNITDGSIHCYKKELLWIIPGYELNNENDQKIYNFILSIRTEKYNNRDCYVITTGKSKTGYTEDWIDKETGFIVRQISESEGLYYRENIYTITFDTVTDEDVTFDSIDNYPDYTYEEKYLPNNSMDIIRETLNY